MRRTRRLLRTVDVTSLDDTELLARIDDTDAVGELIRRHQRPLFAMAQSMLRNTADAEEAVQDTFINAIRSAGTFRGDSTVKTWLHAICYRQVLERSRRKRHLTVTYDTTHDTADTTNDTAFRIALDAAVEGLPDINREAFLLVDVLGFSRADAARILDIEPNTMRARVARARHLLADALTPQAQP